MKQNGSTNYDFNESFERLGVEESEPRRPSPNLYPDLEAGQCFVSPHERLWRIEVLLGTHQRRNTCTLCFLLREEGPQGRIIARAWLPGPAVEDGGWHSLEFQPIEGSAGKRFHLSAYSPDSSVGNTLAWWLNDRSVLENGTARFNGKPAGGSLCFRTFHVTSLPVWENLQLLKRGYAEPLAAQQARPVRLVLEFTSRCNLRCRMCRSWKDFTDRHKELGNMSEEVFEKYLPLVPTAMVIQPQGWGESLVHPRFFPSIEQMRQLNQGAVISFNTNGMLLDQAAAERVIELGISRICVSLDSSRKEVHESIRGGASFDRIMTNMERLVRMREQTGTRTPLLATHIVLMKENIDELPQYVRMCRRAGVEEISLGTLYGCDELQAGDYSPYVGDYLAAREYATEQGITVFGSGVQKFESLIAPPAANGPAPAGPAPLPTPCCDPWEMVFGEYTGKVRPCCNYLGLPVSGDAIGQAVGEIWNGEEQQRLRGQLLGGKPTDHCRDCMGVLFAAGRSVVRFERLVPMLTTDIDQRNPYRLKQLSAIRRKLIYPLIRKMSSGQTGNS